MVCNSQRGNGTSLGVRRGGNKAQDKGDRPMLYQSMYRYRCLIDSRKVSPGTGGWAGVGGSLQRW